ncbi:hypothetical protein J2S49_001247 [Arcanobacterium wilhelmae]|uniref:Restriction endonuclease type II-like domain-containing protein n=1 Tax=Arcanobacterium wilhelmae TaxID=1803177 RepID=A0ABT9NDA3_9ACTO|nr:DNA helicase [Arcanobacterium wilhelmae]MDP9801171.1 hypothetical protein [Arcanobacterium wilhelmae]
MSPFFRRKKLKSEPEAEVQPTPVEPLAPEGDEGDVKAVVAPQITLADRASRDELVSQALRTWHEELWKRAAAADDAAQVEVRRSSVDLTHAHPTGSAMFYSHGITKLSLLVREDRALAQAREALARLRDRIAQMSASHGHAPLSLAFGEFTWTDIAQAQELVADEYELTTELHLDEAEVELEPAEAAVELHEPVVVTEPALLRQVKLEFLEGEDALIQLQHLVEINPVVLRALRENGATGENIAQVRELAAAGDADALLARLVDLARVYLPGFGFEERALLGLFARPERAMLVDLEAIAPYVRTSGVLAALAGDEETAQLTSSPIPAGDREDRAPEAERGAGDHDVDELHAVEAVASGRSFVLDTPPGSEKFSTLASIAADRAASGASVLFVPTDEASAREFVAQMRHEGLDDLLLDLTDAEGAPRRIREGLRLELPKFDVDEVLDVRDKLVRVRRVLGEFVDDLHVADPEWKLSIHDLLEKLAQLTADPNGPATRVRLGSEAVSMLRNEGMDSVKAKFAKAGELGAFNQEFARSAWAGSKISDVAEGTRAVEEARRLHEVSLRAVIAQSSRAAGETGLTQARTLAEWFEQVDVLSGVAESLDTFVPEIFETSAMDMVIATASKEWRVANGHQMKRGERRRFRRQAQDLVRPGVVVNDLHAELTRAQERREVWRRYATEGGWPRLPDGMGQIRVMREEVERDLDALSAHLGGEDLASMPFEALQERLAALVADADHMSSLPARNAIVDELDRFGFGELLRDMVGRGVRAEESGGELELAYTSSVFEQLIAKSRVLAKLAPADVSNLLEHLRYLDQRHVRSLAAPVMLAAVKRGREVMREAKSDTLKLDAQLDERGVGGLHDLIAIYSRIVLAARPVWVAPPTVVAELVPPMPWVDVVMVEAPEAESVAGVVASLVRGRQVVVVGDTRRGAEMEGAPITDFAGVLPVIELPANRAVYNSLAARALMTHGYADVLAPVPAPHGGSSSRLVQVDGRGVPASGSDGAIESTQVEVDAAVDAVLEHAMSRPGESLAVVGISTSHANRIRSAVSALAERSTDVAALLSAPEPLVVVDVAGARGVRRDHVILSVGFGKTVHGRVLHSFGVLATPAGTRGLIDAIEAPRRELTVISSLAPGEIRKDRLSTSGPKLLADLLDAASGSADVPSGHEGASEPLLEDLKRRVEADGWVAQLNYGYEGSVSIPLVVGHPDIPGTWAVAVVFDDDSYVAEKSLRRRDRYRVEMLEVRGWRVHQTFSTSLFIDPAGEAERVGALMREVHERYNPVAVVVPELDDDGWGEVVADEAVSDHAVSELMPRVLPRGPRPAVTPGLALAAYTDDQLDEMAAWIASDGVPRDNEQFMDALRAELGLTRRGGQTDAVLGNVVRRCGQVAGGASEEQIAQAQTAQAEADVAQAEVEAAEELERRELIEPEEPAVDEPGLGGEESEEPAVDEPGLGGEESEELLEQEAEFETEEDLEAEAEAELEHREAIEPNPGEPEIGESEGVKPESPVEEELEAEEELEVEAEEELERRELIEPGDTTPESVADAVLVEDEPEAGMEKTDGLVLDDDPTFEER